MTTRQQLTAVLNASLPLLAGSAVQILPTGEFAGRTGAPGNGLTWKLDDARGAALAATLNQRHAAPRAEFNFDYEHQTMLAASNGQRAPASGWARQFEWRPGQGLFATDARWTAAAAAHIAAREYKYVSPVIAYDGDTGAVTDVLHASLTNFPELMQMAAVTDAVAALNATISRHHGPNHQENDLSLLASLLVALGLPADTQETAALTAAAAMKVKADRAAVPAAVATALGIAATADEVAALSAVNALKQRADKPTLPAGLTTALGIAATADEVAALSAVAALKGGGATDPAALAAIGALQQQVAALSATLNDGKVADMVDLALREGKLIPAQRDWAINLGKANQAQLTAFLSAAPKVAAGLGTTQSGGTDKGGQGEGGLTAQELAICSAMGLKPEHYKAAALKA